MVVSTNRVPVSSKVLEQLITSDNSCVEIVKHEWDMKTLPYHGKKITNAIKEQLNDLIGKFFKKLNGIVLSYKNIKILSDVGFIDDEACLVFSILADFYVFRPSPGKELTAIVTKQSTDHVGCLIYHTFNASIPKPEGVLKWEGDNVEIGQEISFRVTLVKLESKIPFIKGEFFKKNSVKKSIDFNICEESMNNKEEFSNEVTEQKPDVEKRIKKKSKKYLSVSTNEITEKCVSEDDSNINILEEPVRKKKSRKNLISEIESETFSTEQDDHSFSKNERLTKKRSRRSLDSKTEPEENSFDEPKPKKKRKVEL